MHVGPADAGSQHDEAWDRQIGAVWAQILRTHGLDPAGDVAEVGPGFTIKIGLGLQEYGFRGSLYVVEPNARVREWIVPRYRELLPSARVIPVPCRLRSAASGLPTRLNALLMNHVLDDLVLDAVTAKRRCSAIFGNMRQGAPCRPEVRRAWQELAADPAKLALASRTVIDDICYLYHRTRPHLLGVSQYPSWFQTQSGLGLVDEITAPLLRQLQRHLQPVASGGPARLLRCGEKEPRWLVLHSQEVDGRYGERTADVFRDHALWQEEGRQGQRN